LLAYGFAFLDADPVGALDALRRGWVIAQDSGIRCNESYLRSGGHDRRPCVLPTYCGGIPELNIAIAALRNVLGEQTYESLARKGSAMTAAAVATYAYDQIDQARTQLGDRP
jgi:hypothetical protein